MNGQAIAIALAVGVAIWGGAKVVHGVKKAGTAIVHVVHHPKKATAPAPPQETAK